MSAPQQQAPDMTGQWAGWSQIDQGQKTFFMTNTEARAPYDALVTGIEPNFQFRSLSLGSIKPNGTKFSGKTWNYLIYDPASDQLLPLPDFYKQRGVQQVPPKEADYTADFDGHKIAGQFKNDTGTTANSSSGGASPRQSPAASLPSQRLWGP